MKAKEVKLIKHNQEVIIHQSRITQSIVGWFMAIVILMAAFDKILIVMAINNVNLFLLMNKFMFIVFFLCAAMSIGYLLNRQMKNKAESDRLLEQAEDL